MTSRDFCFWLQGFLELTEDPSKDPSKYANAELSCHQVAVIRKHLALVLKHDDEVLNEIRSEIKAL